MTGIAGVIDAFERKPEAIVFTAVLIGFLIVNYVIRRRDRMRGQDGELFLGLKPISAKDLWSYIVKKDFSLLSPWLAPIRIADAYQGNYNGFDICLFQITGGNSTSSYQTAVHIGGVDLPKFVLKPAGCLHRFAALIGKQSDFPTFPGFSESYIIKGKDKGRIRAVLQPQFLQFCQDHKCIIMESTGNALLIYRYGDRGKKEDYSAYIDRAVYILGLLKGAQLKPHVAESFWQDKPEATRKQRLTGALANMVANGFIIAWIYYKIGGIIAHIFTVLLILEGIVFFSVSYGRTKK